MHSLEFTNHHVVQSREVQADTELARATSKQNVQIKKKESWEFRKNLYHVRDRRRPSLRAWNMTGK